jgi:hypothetical protein
MQHRPGFRAFKIPVLSAEVARLRNERDPLIGPARALFRGNPFSPQSAALLELTFGLAQLSAFHQSLFLERPPLAANQTLCPKNQPIPIMTQSRHTGSRAPVVRARGEQTPLQ